MASVLSLKYSAVQMAQKNNLTDATTLGRSIAVSIARGKPSTEAWTAASLRWCKSRSCTLITQLRQRLPGTPSHPPTAINLQEPATQHLHT